MSRPPVRAFAGLTREDGLFIGFQRADGHQAPTWPNQNVPQRSHLDFAVDDLDEAEARVAERLGEHVLPSAGARV